MVHQFLTKTIPIRAVTISLDDVRRLYERLLKHLEDEADRQTKDLVKPADQSNEEFERRVADARKKAFRITITIRGADGEELFGDSGGMFSSSNLPSDIVLIYMTNVVAYEGETGRKPPNGFALTLDFSKPPLIDNNNPVSNPTPNGSGISMDGQRDAWVASVSDAVMGVLRRRNNGRLFLHAAFVYDIGLMLLGLPLGLYVCWRLSGAVGYHLGAVNPFLAAVAYVYLVLLAMWLYRAMFGYTKWAFPTVELREAESKSSKHRRFWYAIVTGILSGAAIEIWKTVA
jgi:hypothetical protein